MTELLDRPTAPINTPNRWSYVVTAPNYAAGFDNEDEALKHQEFMNQKTGSTRYSVSSSTQIKIEKIDSPTFTQPQFREEEDGKIIIDYSLSPIHLPYNMLNRTNGKS